MQAALAMEHLSQALESRAEALEEFRRLASVSDEASRAEKVKVERLSDKFQSRECRRIEAMKQILDGAMRKEEEMLTRRLRLLRRLRRDAIGLIDPMSDVRNFAHCRRVDALR